MASLFLQIEGLENEEAQKEARSLRQWLESDEDLDYDKIETLRKELAPDEAGGALEAVLAVVLGAPAVVHLVKSLQVFFREKTKTANGQKLKIDITTPNGGKLKIDAQQMNRDTADLVREISALLQNQKAEQ
jgi:hypothetical protein